MHLYDAQKILNTVPTKAAKKLAVMVNAARKNGVQEGLEEKRLFVKSVICGKAYLHKKMEFKGRGRTGKIRVPKCSVKLVLEEKPLEEFYRMILQGKCPPGLAEYYKNLLVQSEADYEHLSRASFMLSAKGRYYRKQQFKRLVIMVEKEAKAAGNHVKRSKIERNLLDKAVAQMVKDTQRIEEAEIFRLSEQLPALVHSFPHARWTVNEAGQLLC